MKPEQIRADITAEATDYILDRYTNQPMEEPSEIRFQNLLQEFEINKRQFLNSAETRLVKINLRWVWENITPGLCPPSNVRVQMEDSATGWKQKVLDVVEKDGKEANMVGTFKNLDDVKERYPYPEPNAVCYLSDVGIHGDIYVGYVEQGRWVQALLSDLMEGNENE